MSMFDQSKWVWMDGEFVPWRDATVHVSSHALHYGTGVFEGIRCYETAHGAAIFRVDAHLERFYASAAVYGMKILFTSSELTDVICELIRRNEFENCYVRPICYYGSDNLGIIPDKCPLHLSIFAWPWKRYHAGSPFENGISVMISSWKKFHSSMMPTAAKACGQYLNSVLAVRAAAAEGYDEALLLDVNGCIAEGSGENVFVVRDGTVLTNGEGDSILMGVTRDAITTIARDLGLPVEIRQLQVDDLLSADEAFFTGTAVEVTPIRAVDGKPLGQGTRGSITKLIQQKFFDTVKGRAPEYRSWLHPVAVVKADSRGGQGLDEGNLVARASSEPLRRR